MLRVLAVIATISCLLTGCVKSDAKVVLKADGSGTLNYESTYSLAAVESARERIDELAGSGRGAGGADQATARLDRFVKSFDPAQVTADLKARGVDVVSVKPVEKDGWKGVVVEARFSDVNQMVARLREIEQGARAGRQPDEQPAGDGDGSRRRRGGGGGMMGAFGRDLDVDANPMLPRTFEKTTESNIGRAILLSPRPTEPRGDDRGAGRQGRRGGFGGGGMIPGADDLRRTLRITLPGKVIEASNCKKVDDHTVLLDVKGSDLAPDDDGNLPALLTGGAFVTFEIPDDCGITFEAPSGARKPEKNEDEPKEDEPKKRKGDLKIGE